MHKRTVATLATKYFVPAIRNLNMKHFTANLHQQKQIMRLRYIFLLSLVAVACGTEKKSREPLVPQKEYTRENPAEWSQLTKSHLPVVILHPEQKTNNVEIVVPIQSKSLDHYVEVVGILDSQNHEIASQKISHERLQNVVRVYFTADPSLPGLKAFARCSQHDLWTTPFP